MQLPRPTPKDSDLKGIGIFWKNFPVTLLYRFKAEVLKVWSRDHCHENMFEMQMFGPTESRILGIGTSVKGDLPVILIHAKMWEPLF